jgi:enoyl-CoA hydratase
VKTLSHASEYIGEEFADGILTLRFCRPAERNTLSSETLTVFGQILDRISSARAVIITGADDVFLSGANIRELVKLDSYKAIEFSKRGQELTQRLADLQPVTIAAINGYCLGGGLDFALACDIRVASRNALFAHPGAKLGIITGWGGTQRLPRVVGRTKALELFATARRLDSGEALRAGLVTEVGDPVLEIARRIAMNT